MNVSSGSACRTARPVSAKPYVWKASADVASAPSEQPCHEFVADVRDRARGCRVRRVRSRLTGVCRWRGVMVDDRSGCRQRPLPGQRACNFVPECRGSLAEMDGDHRRRCLRDAGCGGWGGLFRRFWRHGLEARRQHRRGDLVARGLGLHGSRRRLRALESVARRQRAHRRHEQESGSARHQRDGRHVAVEDAREPRPARNDDGLARARGQHRDHGGLGGGRGGDDLGSAAGHDECNVPCRRCRRRCPDRSAALAHLRASEQQRADHEPRRADQSRR